MKNNSIYLKIAEIIKHRIENNTYPQDSNLPSMKNFEKEFNVHRNTIKNVFAKLRELHLIEHHHGSLVRVRNNTRSNMKIGLILPAAYPGIHELLAGIKEPLKTHPGNMIETMFYDNVAEQSECLKHAVEHDFTGIIIRPDLSCHGCNDLTGLQAAGFPVVLIENFYPSFTGWHVDAGAFEAAFLAVEHLRKERREPIAVVCPADKFGAAFMDGYKEAHAKLKIECWRNNIKILENGKSAAGLTLELMPLKSVPNSIIYANPADALSGYAALKAQGKNIHWMRLISFGELPGSEFFEQPIIPIRRDFKELGRKAGMLLIEQINTPRMERKKQRKEKIKVAF